MQNAQLCILDADEELRPALERLGYQRGKHFLSVGKDASGRRNIEELIPEPIIQTVYAAHASLVTQAMNGTPKEKTSARKQLKRLIFEQVKSSSREKSELFQGFFPLIKSINGAMSV